MPCQVVRGRCREEGVWSRARGYSCRWEGQGRPLPSSAGLSAGRWARSPGDQHFKPGEPLCAVVTVRRPSCGSIVNEAGS